MAASTLFVKASMGALNVSSAVFSTMRSSSVSMQLRNLRAGVASP